MTARAQGGHTLPHSAGWSWSNSRMPFATSTDGLRRSCHSRSSLASISSVFSSLTISLCILLSSLVFLSYPCLR
jgi:hypothetical protein